MKPFKTFQEQLEILKNRELSCTSEENVCKTLQHINYYRLSGYTLTLRQNNTFHQAVSFDEIMQIYHLDSHLRHLLLYLLDHVEVAFRTHIAYHHTENFGVIGYLNAANFINPAYHAKFIEALKGYINKSNRTIEPFVAHHEKVYNGKFPFWVAIELLSFTDLSMLYKNLPHSIKKQISNSYYGIPNPQYIETWLHGLCVVRNISAHRGRLYNRLIPIKPRLSKEDQGLKLANNRLFIYIYLLKKLTWDKNVWDYFLDSLDITFKQYSFVDLSHLGFPENWYDLLKL